MNVVVRYDRVGAVYCAGETVTGVVEVTSPSASTHGGIMLEITGGLSLHASARGFASFEPVVASIPQVRFLQQTITLAKKDERIPAGTVQLPFSFLLGPSAGADGALLETYNGVFVSCSYQATATVVFTFSRTASTPAPLLVICRGQSVHFRDHAHADDRVPHAFALSDASIANNGRKMAAPTFSVVGEISLLNDIDVPLNGWVNIERCNRTITSLELQFIRVESAASSAGLGKEATEIQNIQLGEGDVPREVRIPIYMFFPRWFTCPTVRTPQIRVDFEVNLVITFDDRTQITHNFPLHLYRAPAAAAGGDTASSAAASPTDL